MSHKIIETKRKGTEKMTGFESKVKEKAEQM